MKLDIQSFGCAGPVKNDSQRSFRHDCRVKLLELTRRGVARVCKQRQALLLAVVIQFFEAFPIHVNFAAHFQEFWRAVAQALRHRADRPDILRDIIAHVSVSAC